MFTVAAGVLFGAAWGLALTITGTALAALAAYGLVRWVGGPLVARHEHRPGFAWVRARLDRSGLLAMVSLRLLPMVPFSVLNYAAGVARVRLVPYLLGTVLGVLPGTIAIVVLGDAVTSGDFNPALFAVSFAGAALGLAGAAIAARRVGPRCAAVPGHDLAARLPRGLRARPSCVAGTVAVGPTWPHTASRVFSPSPVMSSTVSASGSSWPASISLRAVATVTPPAVSANTPSVRGQQPDALDDLARRRRRPPRRRCGARRRARTARRPGCRSPASGRSCPAAPGGITSWPSANAFATGEQPVACAPNTRYGVGSTSPSLPSSWKPLSTLVSCEPDATGTTICSGQPPPELLGDLEAQRLGALRVVRADVDVDERPVLVLGRQLGGEPVDVVVVAVDGQQRAAVHGRREDLGLLERRRDEHHGVPARAGGRGGDGVGQVAGGRAGTARVKPSSRAAARATATTRSLNECVGLPVSSLTHSVRMPSAAAQPVGLDQPGEAGLGVGVLGDVGGHGQQVPVAPDRLRARLDRGPGDVAEVVGDLERTEALRCRRTRRRAAISWPHSRHDSARAGPRSKEVDVLRSAVSVIGGSPHLPRATRVGIGTVIDRARSPVAGVHRAVPSAPLDEPYAVVADRRVRTARRRRRPKSSPPIWEPRHATVGALVHDGRMTPGPRLCSSSSVRRSCSSSGPCEAIVARGPRRRSRRPSCAGSARGETTPADLVESLSPVAVRRGAGRRAAGRARGGQGRSPRRCSTWRPISPRAWSLVVQHAGGARNKALADALRKAEAPPSPRAIGSPATRSGPSSSAARCGGRAARIAQAAVGGADRGGRLGPARAGRGHGPARRRHRRHRRRVGGAALLPRARRGVGVRGGRQGGRRRSGGRAGGAALGAAARRAVRC